VAKFRIKIKAKQNICGKTKSRYDVTKLRNNNTGEEFNLQVRNRCTVLPEETTDSKTEKWNNIVKDVYLKTCEKVIIYKNNTKKERISEKTWMKLLMGEN
jgi:predicted acetyltransferase